MNKNQKEWFKKVWNDAELGSLKNSLFTIIRRNSYGLNQKEFLLFMENFNLFKSELFYCVQCLIAKYLMKLQNDNLQINYVRPSEQTYDVIDITEIDNETTNKIIERNKEWLLKNEPIKWMGTQKEFAELIIELQQKNWIKNDDSQSIADTAKEFATHFDLTGTKKNKNSNEVNSLYQLLKPQQSKELDYEKKYPQIYSKRYVAKFKDVKERKIK